MKKIIAMLLAVVMLAAMFAMTACENEDAGDDTNAGTNAGTNAPADTNGSNAPADDTTAAPAGDDTAAPAGDNSPTAEYDAMAAGDNVCMLSEKVFDLGEVSCASWESPYALIDGNVPEGSYWATSGEPGVGGAYGDWGSFTTNESVLTLVWQHPVTVDGFGIYFWSDKSADREAARAAWVTEGGTDFAAEYTIQYLNEDGEFVDVTNASGFGVEADVMNKTTFDKVTTTEIQITWNKLSAEEIESLGGDESTIDWAGHGVGIWEVEVYKAG